MTTQTDAAQLAAEFPQATAADLVPYAMETAQDATEEATGAGPVALVRLLLQLGATADDIRFHLCTELGQRGIDVGPPPAAPAAQPPRADLVAALDAHIATLTEARGYATTGPDTWQNWDSVAALLGDAYHAIDGTRRAAWALAAQADEAAATETLTVDTDRATIYAAWHAVYPDRIVPPTRGSSTHPGRVEVHSLNRETASAFSTALAQRGIGVL
jgi:hypothetical protein